MDKEKAVKIVISILCILLAIAVCYNGNESGLMLFASGMIAGGTIIEIFNTSIKELLDK